MGQTTAMSSNHSDMHGLLGSAPAHSATVGSLGQAFPASVMSLGSRHPSLVSVEPLWQLVETCWGPSGPPGFHRITEYVWLEGNLQRSSPLQMARTASNKADGPGTHQVWP